MHFGTRSNAHNDIINDIHGNSATITTPLTEHI